MATNTEHPRRFDLRETIPLATETLIALAKQPKRSWAIPALTLITGFAFMILMLELLVFPGPVSALAFEGKLRSRLSANYGADPIVARIHELRLTIVEEVLGMDGGGGSESPAIILLMQDPVPSATPKATSPTSLLMQDPVPSATPKATSPTSQPSASPVSSDVPTDIPVETASPVSQPSASPVSSDVPTDIPVETASPVPSNTPPPPTSIAVVGYCDKLSIFSMKVKGDHVEARVRNSGSSDVYLIETVFEWPDVPDPAYVDYFELKGIKGDDKYNHNPTSSGNSPSISTLDYEKLRKGRTEKWKVEFDDVPGGKIYGSFFLTLTFDVPGQGAHCSVSGGTFKAPPAPTDLPAPTETPEPVSSGTPEPTPTDMAPTDTPDPASTDAPAPTDTSATEPTATPE